MISFLEVVSASRPRWLRLWLVLLNVALVVAALALGFWASRRAIFLVFLVPIAIVPFSYARWRLHTTIASHLHRTPKVLAALATIAILFDVVLVAQLLTGRSPEMLPWLQAPGVTWIGPVWFSAHAIMFLGLLLAAALLGLRRGARRARVWLRARSGDASADSRSGSRIAIPIATVESPARRQLLQRAGLLGAGVPFFVSLSSVPLSYDLRVEERELELPHWPRELDGFRVAHLSDIHVGGGMTRARLLRMQELTNQSRPDLVAHTGDFLTHRDGDFDAPLYEALAGIRAPFGQWACLGNHDFDAPERLVRRLAAAGVVGLRDRVTTVAVRGQTLELAGCDFEFARAQRREIYSRLMSSWTPRSKAPRILLNHDPTGFSELPDDAADLVLSGHTHGGHVGVQLGRDHAITVVGLVGIPDQGVFERGDMRMFVTRCVGFYGYPMRVGIPPEIALLVLRSPRARAEAV